MAWVIDVSSPNLRFMFLLVTSFLMAEISSDGEALEDGEVNEDRKQPKGMHFVTLFTLLNFNILDSCMATVQCMCLRSYSV